MDIELQKQFINVVKCQFYSIKLTISHFSVTFLMGSIVFAFVFCFARDGIRCLSNAWSRGCTREVAFVTSALFVAAAFRYRRGVVTPNAVEQSRLSIL